MSPRRPRPFFSSESLLAAGLAAACVLALALPAGAAEPAEISKKKAPNWTVFLASGSTMAAAEVHHVEESDRYEVLLPSGGRITLPATAVRRVSRDTEDRVEKAAPVVAAAGAGPRPGPVPGSLDTTGLLPKPIQTRVVKPEGETLKARAEARRMALGGAMAGEEGARTRSAREEALTPKPGRMERMLRRANRPPVSPSKR